MKRLIIICASLFFLAGCVSEKEDFNSYSGDKTLNVSFEPATKIQLDENQHPVWNEGDLLSVFNYRDVNGRWKFMGETGATTGVIASDEVANGGVTIDDIVVVYPYREDYVLSPGDKTISTTFASVQTYLEGSYGLNDNVMISSGASENIILKNVFGWLKLQITGTVSIKKIMVYDNDFVQLHGPIEIYYETLDVKFAEYGAGCDLGGVSVDNFTLTLDCGDGGVALNPSKPTSFYIAIVPRTFKNGFTVEITGTDGTVMTKRVSREIVIDRNVVKPFSDFVYVAETDGETTYTNLSVDGTANSYIVSSSGDYKFKAVQGNSNWPVRDIATAEVLWETFGTDVTPNVGDLVSDVKYNNGYISFKAFDRKGNASIAAKDASGNILWSWHIWMTDMPADQVYNNNAGTMMDRNLGATSATPGDAGALGLLYQWGRKDPFLGSYTISGSKNAKSTITWPTAEPSMSSNGTIAYATAHPTTFITFNGNNSDWWYSSERNETDNTRWSSIKTIYDPCPVGYHVPDGGDDGVWATAFGTSFMFNEPAFDSTNKGFDFGKSDTGKYLTEEATCWYPAAGYLSYSYGSFGNMGNVGLEGSYWSTSPCGHDAYDLLFGNTGLVYPSLSFHRSYGQSVRCLKD